MNPLSAFGGFNDVAKSLEAASASFADGLQVSRAMLAELRETNRLLRLIGCELAAIGDVIDQKEKV